MQLAKRNLTQEGDKACLTQIEKKARRSCPRITPNTVTVIVCLSLLFCTCIVIWGMVQAQCGVDSSSIVDSALRVFGTELGICGLLTMYKRWVELQDRRVEERRRGEKDVTRNNESDDSEFADS